ncbi:MAG: nitrilase-related carbon-nitrogen hydrolase [Chloroflexia bacterium]
MTPGFRAAAIQFEPKHGAIAENLGRIASLAEQAAREGCRLLVFPEMATTGYVFESREEVAALAEPIPGPSTDRLAKVAASHDCFIVVGLPEVDPQTGALYNSAVLVGPQGLAGKVRKVHLYSADTHWARSGTLGFPVWQTPLARIGCLICMDACYPEPARVLALQGAEVLCLPTNWVEERAPAADWFTRAFENGVYWIAADRYGRERGVQFSGGSCIIGPDGQLLAVQDAGEGIVTSEIAPRETGPQVERPSRRPELYAPLLLHPPWSLDRFPRQFCEARPLPPGGVWTVAVVQVGYPRLQPDAARARTEERLLHWLREAGRSVDLVVLPELAFVPQPQRAGEWAEPIPGPSTEWAVRLSRRVGAVVVFGLPERDGDARYNSVAVCSADGLLARYRKVHLNRQEREWAAPGEQGPMLCELPFGRVGFLVGEEALLPEWPRVLAVLGADLVCAPSAVRGPRPADLPPTRLPLAPDLRAIPDTAYWHLWRARAAENNLYLAFANRGDHPFMGWSGLFGPRLLPRVEAHIEGPGEQVAWMEVDTRDFLEAYGPNPVRYKELVRSRQTHTYDALATVEPGPNGGASASAEIR